MKSWFAIADAIFKANIVSLFSHGAGMCIHPIMDMGPDGGMTIALERKGIVAAWEIPI